LVISRTSWSANSSARIEAGLPRAVVVDDVIVVIAVDVAADVLPNGAAAGDGLGEPVAVTIGELHVCVARVLVGDVRLPRRAAIDQGGHDLEVDVGDAIRSSTTLEYQPPLVGSALE
jgi:hypothetical protein